MRITQLVLSLPWIHAWRSSIYYDWLANVNANSTASITNVLVDLFSSVVVSLRKSNKLTRDLHHIALVEWSKDTFNFLLIAQSIICRAYLLLVLTSKIEWSSSYCHRRRSRSIDRWYRDVSRAAGFSSNQLKLLPTTQRPSGYLKSHLHLTYTPK